MTPTVETKTTITFVDNYEDDMYLTYVGKRSDGSWACNADEDAASACDISHLPIEEQIEIMARLEDDYEGSCFRIIKIETTTTDMDFRLDEYKEAIQKNALKKLSLYEIEALGLGKIALYIKTKYHNTDSASVEA